MYRIMFLISMSMMISACSTNPMKSPCDQYGHFCGTKIAINKFRG